MRNSKTQEIMARICVAVIVAIGIVACAEQHAAEFDRINRLAETAPEMAQQALDSLDPAQMCEADRMHYDLLSIKTADKNYQKHTSDSLIKEIVAYYEKREDNPLYPEALYYAGRVYYDMGDYPSSLHYYQDALDKLDNKSGIKGRVLSQISEVLNVIHLYKEAIPYVQASIDFDISNQDSINLINDKEKLGVLFMRLEEYSMADSIFCQIVNIVGKEDLVLQNRIKTRMAFLERKRKNIDSALVLIREVLEKIDWRFKSQALVEAINVFDAAGKEDSAYMYARELIKMSDSPNRRFGYGYLFQYGIDKGIYRDTLKEWAREYDKLTDETVGQNQNESALLQNSVYNYRIQERDKERARQYSIVLCKVILGLIILSLGLAIAWMYVKYKKNKQYIELLKAQELISILSASRSDVIDREADGKNEEARQSDSTMEGESMQNVESKVPEIKSILNNIPGRKPVPEDILLSDVYAEIKKSVKSKVVIGDNSCLWEDLHNLVTTVSPGFKNKLNILMEGKLTDVIYHTSLLIKCGLPLSEISILLGEDISSISVRRERMGKKIFARKGMKSEIDALISIL